MNHDIYEEWLFTYYDERSEETLSSDEVLKLQAHLKGCAPCRQLADAWQQVDAELRSAPALAPMAGFTERFQARMAIDHQRVQRRQTLAVLGFSILAVVLLFGSLLILALPLFQSPKVLVWAVISQVIELTSFLETAQNVLVPILQTATGSVPTFWWMIAAGLLTELGVLWVVSYRILTNPRRITQ